MKITDNNKAISSAFGSLNVTNAVFDCPCSLHSTPKLVKKGTLELKYTV